MIFLAENPRAELMPLFILTKLVTKPRNEIIHKPLAFIVKKHFWQISKSDISSL